MSTGVGYTCMLLSIHISSKAIFSEALLMSTHNICFQKLLSGYPILSGAKI